MNANVTRVADRTHIAPLGGRANEVHGPGEVGEVGEVGNGGEVAEVGEIGLNAPPTFMVPPRRDGVFAVIHLDDREVTLRVAALTARGSFQTLRSEREAFMPGGRNAQDPRLVATQVAVSLADILSRFQRIAEMHGAAVRAVAGQAFLSVPNAYNLLKRLPRVTRVALELLSERDAARIVCLAALRGRGRGERSLVIDVGDEATSITLAEAEEPLALWRLAIGTTQLMALGGSSERIQAASWRRRIQQTLALGHLETIRGAAPQAVLLKRREPAPVAAPPVDRQGGARADADADASSDADADGEVLRRLATIALLEEIAAYLNIAQVQSTERGLQDGILIELSRAVVGVAAITASQIQSTPRFR